MPVNSFENYPMTWKPIIDKTVQSIYHYLADQLEQHIVNGTLLPGTKLPPQRELADYLDLNVSTVSKAFKLCEQKGLLSAKVGSGTFVSFDALSNAYLLAESKPQGLVEMGATLPEPASYEPLMSQLKNMVIESDFAKWFSYSRPNDVLWQKDAAVKLMCKSGYITNKDTLINACKNENIKGIYLVPDYQNPTTHRMSLPRRKALASIANEYHIFIIEDATYPLMCRETVQAVATYAPEQVIYIASLSKSIGPGLRLAYVSVPDMYRNLLSNGLYNMNISVSPLLAELAARTIVSGSIDTIVESHRNNTILRNQLVNKYLSKYECHGEETCIFRWLKLSANITGAEFEALAFEQGVQVYAAERFSVGNCIPEKAVRISVGAPETIEELERGLIILQRLLQTINK